MSDEEIGRSLFLSIFRPTQHIQAAELYPLQNLGALAGSKFAVAQQRMLNTSDLIAENLLAEALEEVDSAHYLVTLSFAMRRKFELAGRAFRLWRSQGLPLSKIKATERKRRTALFADNRAKQIKLKRQVRELRQIARPLRRANPNMPDTKLAEAISRQMGIAAETVRKRLPKTGFDKRSFNMRRKSRLQRD